MITTPDGYTIGILAAPNFLFANPESKSQAWPGEINAVNIKANIVSVFMISTLPSISMPPKRSDLGFIRGVVTRKGQIAAGQHVACMNSRFNLVAETISAADGSYRFDSLSIYDTYIVIAQDNWDFKYAPVGADRRTPEAYS